MKHILELSRQLAALLLGTTARAANEATQKIVRSCAGIALAINEPGSGDEPTWHRFSSYGQYPVTAKFQDGRQAEVTQIVDREAGMAMASNLGKMIGSVADWFRGAPVYVGHPDDPAWAAKNPGYQKVAIGRVKKVVAREDGPYALIAWNARGKEMISGDAAPLSCVSPNWGMQPVPGQPLKMRPVVLYSLGLVERSNIPANTIGLNELENFGSPEGAEQTETTTPKAMLKPEILAALGLKPDADANAINDAVSNLLRETGETKNKLTAAEAKATEQANLAKAANDALATVRGSAIDTAIAAAVNDGRITEVDKEKWKSALAADYDAELAKLNAKMPDKARALNSRDHVSGAHAPGVTPPGSEQLSATAINEAVKAHAKAEGIDITTEAGWARAWDAAKAAKKI